MQRFKELSLGVAHKKEGDQPYNNRMYPYFSLNQRSFSMDAAPKISLALPENLLTPPEPAVLHQTFPEEFAGYTPYEIRATVYGGNFFYEFFRYGLAQRMLIEKGVLATSHDDVDANYPIYVYPGETRAIDTFIRKNPQLFMYLAQMEMVAALANRKEKEIKSNITVENREVYQAARRGNHQFDDMRESTEIYVFNSLLDIWEKQDHGKNSQYGEDSHTRRDVRAKLLRN